MIEPQTTMNQHLKQMIDYQRPKSQNNKERIQFKGVLSHLKEFDREKS